MSFNPNKLIRTEDYTPIKNGGRLIKKPLSLDRFSAQQTETNKSKRTELHEARPLISPESSARGEKIEHYRTLSQEENLRSEIFAKSARDIYAEAMTNPKFADGTSWNATSQEFRKYMFTKDLSNKYKKLAETSAKMADLSLYQPPLIGESAFVKGTEDRPRIITVKKYDRANGNVESNRGEFFTTNSLVRENLYRLQKQQTVTGNEITELNELLKSENDKKTPVDFSELINDVPITQPKQKIGAWSKLKNFFGFGKKTQDEDTLPKLSKAEISQLEKDYDEKIRGTNSSGNKALARMSDRAVKGGIKPAFNKNPNRFAAGLEVLPEEETEEDLATTKIIQKAKEKADRDIEKKSRPFDDEIAEFKPRGFEKWVKKYDRMFENQVDEIRSWFIEKKANNPKQQLKTLLREQEKEIKQNESAEKYSEKLSRKDRQGLLKEMNDIDKFEQHDLDNHYDEIRGYAKSSRDNANKKAQKKKP
ncbi:MAG: hypothetical protein WCT18_02560 [Patescibacteria group bacterium]